MDDETNNTPEQGNEPQQPLEQLTFADPICRCESQAIYRNPLTGQVFQLTASGSDPEALKNFLANLKVYFEAKPGGEEPSFEDDRQSEYNRENRYSEEQPEIVLKVDVVDTVGIEHPYTVDFAIDPIINAQNRLSPQSFVFFGRWISVSIHADDGSMDSSLSGVSFPRYAFVSDNGPSLRSLGGSAPGNSRASLTVSVSGSGVFDLAGSYGS